MELRTRLHGEQLLAAAFGPGEHTLAFDQWKNDDGSVEPECFQLVAVSASGEEAEGPEDCGDAARSVGCATGAPTGGLGLLGVAALRVRRRRRP